MINFGAKMINFGAEMIRGICDSLDSLDSLDHLDPAGHAQNEPGRSLTP